MQQVDENLNKIKEKKLNDEKEKLQEEEKALNLRKQQQARNEKMLDKERHRKEAERAEKEKFSDFAADESVKAILASNAKTLTTVISSYKIYTEKGNNGAATAAPLDDYMTFRGFTHFCS